METGGGFNSYYLTVYFWPTPAGWPQAGTGKFLPLVTGRTIQTCRSHTAGALGELSLY